MVTPKRIHALLRVAVVVVVVLFFSTLALWTFALTGAMQKAPPFVLTFAPDQVVHGARFPFRVVVLDAHSKLLLPCEGTARVTSAAHVAKPLVQCTTELLAPETGNQVDVIVDVSIGGEVVSATATIKLTRSKRDVAQTFSPWTRALKTVVDDKEGSVATYPEFGMVSSAFSSNIVVVGEGISIHPSPPSILFAKDPLGRDLEIRRGGIRVSTSVLHEPGARSIQLSIRSDEDQSLYVDVLVDGHFKTTSLIDVVSGENSAALDVEEIFEGQICTVRANTSPFSRKRGRVAHSIVSSNYEAARAGLLRRLAPLGLQDPLLEELSRGFPESMSDVDKEVVMRALLSRFSIGPAHLPRQGLSIQMQRAAWDKRKQTKLLAMRNPFRLCALSFAVIATAIAIGPALATRRRRQAVLDDADDDGDGLDDILESSWNRMRGFILGGLALLVALGVFGVLDWTLTLSGR